MNKTTLSSYGFIVVCTLVLSVMIALATPFGEFIRNSVESTLNGFIDTNNQVIDVVAPVTQPSLPDVPDDETNYPIENFKIEYGKKYRLVQDCGCTMEAMFLEDGTFLGFVNNVFNAGYYQKANYDLENGKITVDGLKEKYFTIDENNIITLHQEGATPVSTEMTLTNETVTFVNTMQQNVNYRYETPQEMIDKALEENAGYLKQIDFVYEQINDGGLKNVYHYRELYLNPEDIIEEEFYDEDIGVFMDGKFILDDGFIFAILIKDNTINKPQLQMEDRIYNEV